MVYFLNGLAFSMLLFIVAAGVNISFGFLGVINFSHGALFLLGAYLAYTIINTIGSFWVALLAAPLGIALIGGAMEYFFLRRLYNRHHSYTILLTFASLLVFYDVIKLFWGTDVKTIVPPPFLSGAVPIFGRVFPVVSIYIAAAGVLTAVGLWLVFDRTKMGKILRAVTLDREMAGALGFNVDRTFLFAFMLSALLAGLAGVLASVKMSFLPGSDVDFLIYSFAIVVIGGLRSFKGTFIASLVVGEMHVVGGVFFPDIALALIFILLVIFLSILPRGLFGREIEPVHVPIAPYVEKLRPEKIALIGRIPRRYLSGTNFVLVAVIILLAPLAVSNYWVMLFTEILIFGLFAGSFNILFGYTGLLSFAQAAIFGASAYTVSLFLLHLTSSWSLAFLASLAFATVVALIIGFCSIHRSEIFFAMLTLGFGQLFYSTVYKWNSLTGGADGLSGVPHPQISFGDWQLLIKSPLQNYYFVLAVFVLCYFALYKVINSSFGQTLLAIRENPLRAEYMGLNTRRIRLKVFVIAGFFCGVSGALFAPFGGTIDPHMAHWAKSGEPVFMTLMGGIGTLFGPFIGTFIYYFLQSLISSRTEYWMLVLGTILITIVMGFPIGILGYIKKLLLLKARKD